MATDKIKLVKGLYLMAFSFPFIFFGPALYFWKGAQGHWGFTAASIALMATAVVLGVSGLRMVLSAFFDKSPEKEN